MRVTESTISKADAGSLSPSTSCNLVISDDFDESETVASDIPEYVYIYSEPLLINAPSTSSRRSNCKVTKKHRDSPKVVSVCNSETDLQQSRISNDELESMKRMIHDVKSDPTLIYKRLCVRYDDSTIQRGCMKMDEMERISNDELQSMKRMIDDVKSDPTLIYKRLYVRYDDSTIQRGRMKMDELTARCRSPQESEDATSASASAR